jgi:hypothetical protein
MRYQSVSPQENIFSFHKFSESRHQFDGVSNLRQAFTQAPKAIIVAIAARAMQARCANRRSTGEAIRMQKLRRRFDLMSKSRRFAQSRKASPITAVPRNILLKPYRND